MVQSSSTLTGNIHDGVAITVRKNIWFCVEDDILLETLAVEIDTPDRPILIVTSYLPPRHPFILCPNFLHLFRRYIPFTFIGDLNARHPAIGSHTTNQAGYELNCYLTNNTIRHLGPHFPTYYSPLSASSPNIVLTNNDSYLNYAIQPGSLTSSDHIPIILDIS